jgi:hypothetical protein
MTAVLPIAVALVALLYASVGHAGATGYIAVMALLGLEPRVIRPTALVLNVIVATIGTVQFFRAGHFRADLFLPLAIASIPCAVIGGAINLPTGLFEVVLGIVLLVSAARIIGAARMPDRSGVGASEDVRGMPPAALPAVGAAIGLLSGLTGVGGGIFLTPLLLACNAAPVKTIAGVTAPFILVNSLAGLVGGLLSGRSLPPISGGVVAAAVLGGMIGSTMGAFRLPVAALRLLMAAVLAIASVKLLGEAAWN